jgi:hypothetical protein
MVAGSDDWGMKRTCCTKHWDDLKKTINVKNDIEDKFLDDYLKIYILFEGNSATLEDCLKKLAAQLTVKKTDGGVRNDNYTKLSVVLSEFEQYCWFPPNHEIFIGFVPSESFQDYIARGLMPKDPGAGVLHGDFTHRLQWHVISRIITKEFSTCRRIGWHKSPLELYTSLGRAPATTNNVWFNLLDDSNADTNRHPDRFHTFTRQPQFGLLSDCLQRRYANRRREFDKNYDPNVADAMANEPRVPSPTPDNPLKTITAKKHYWNKAQEMANEAYRRKKEDRRGFDVVPELPVLVRNGVDADTMDIDQRIRASRARLNMVAKWSLDYRTYSPQLGMVTRIGRGDGLENLGKLQARKK